MSYLQGQQTNRVNVKRSPVPMSSTVKANNRQTPNHMGSMTYQIPPMEAFKRFLIIGTESNTLYASSTEMTKGAMAIAEHVAQTDGLNMVNIIRDISTRRVAVKNDPAIYSLAAAMTHGNVATKQAASLCMNEVVRTGTDLFTFIQFVKSMRGFGRSVRTAISNWYNMKDAESLSYQLAKYRQRNGWTHMDVLRLAHVTPGEGYVQSAFQWLKNPNDYPTEEAIEERLNFIVHYENLKRMTTPSGVAQYISQYPNVPWEIVPTQFLKDSEVWASMLPTLPMNALMRNLGRMSSIGVFDNTRNVEVVEGKLSDSELIRKSGLHPVKSMIAYKTYVSGHGDKGSLSWNVNHRISDAIDKAIHYGFSLATPTGKRICLALDVSGSMGSGECAGINLMPAEVSALMSRTLVTSEKDAYVMAFTSELIPLHIHKDMSFRQVMAQVQRSDWGYTNISAPIEWSIQTGTDVDAFVIITDNDVNGGNNVSDSLSRHRAKFGHRTKLMVMATTTTTRSVADPHDPDQLDVSGFSADVPQAMSSFITM
jgi:60 kDa SS-A/Ro ribonucleoprotein